MESVVYFLRKIRRISVWRSEDWEGDKQSALDEIYDVHVRGGKGLSLWKVTDEADESAVLAIMAELSPSKPNTSCYFKIPLEDLEELGLVPRPTPDGTSSSHRRARKLHHDLLGLSAEDCQRLTDYLHRNLERITERRTKSELKKVVKAEISNFESEAVQSRLTKISRTSGK